MGTYALLIAEKGQSKVETWEVKHGNRSTSLRFSVTDTGNQLGVAVEAKEPGVLHREKSWDAL